MVIRTAPIHYRVEIADVNAHLFRVTLTIAKPSATQCVSLPVWIPGSYLVREFAKNLQCLQAQQGRSTLPLLQLDKCTWQIDCATNKALTLHYEIYAFDSSVRAAWLDGTRGFFNGTSICLRVHGQEACQHSLMLLQHASTKDWCVATAAIPLKVKSNGFGLYQSPNYDALVDCPFEMGTFWSGEFLAHGVPHRLAVSGAAATFDHDRLLADVKKICETEIRFWHLKGKPLHSHYLMLLNVVDDAYGGLEHSNATALICARRDLPRCGETKASDGYITLLGLISHEYFHTWNVKRLRPANFVHYDYTQENYTPLLWFFEGFTSYYDDLLLRRAGLIDSGTYLKLLNKTMNQVLQSPGRLVQSVAQASMDAWVKYYRQDENTANATISYYTKGALIAMCFDLTLRQEGRTTLDDVMRLLWKRCVSNKKNGAMTEDDFAQALEDLSGRSYAAEIASWIHSTDELPLRNLLNEHGVSVHDDPPQLAQLLGLRVNEASHLIRVTTVLRGAAAEKSGLAAGDELLGIVINGVSWRIHKLEDLWLYIDPIRDKRQKIELLAARDKKIHHLVLELPHNLTTWRLRQDDAEKLSNWLGGASA